MQKFSPEQDFLTLYFDVSENTHVSISTLGRSLIEFEKLAKEVAARTDPFASFDLGFQRTEPGSLRVITRLKERLDEVRLRQLAKVIIAALLLQPIVGIVSEDAWRALLEKAGYPEDTMSTEEINSIAKQLAEILQDESVKHSRNNLYNTLEADDNIKAFGAKPDSSPGRPRAIIPREKFGIMGLPETGEVEADPVPRNVTIETTLILDRPVLRRASKAVWEFRMEGQKIVARIADAEFLDDALSGRTTIPLVEGLEMTVAMEDHQEFFDGVWHHKSYTIIKVIEVKMPPVQPSFPLAQRREQENDDK